MDAAAPPVQPDAGAGTNGAARTLHRHLRPRSPWRSPGRWFVVILIALAIAQEGIASYYDHVLTDAARRMTGRDDVEVHCLRVWDLASDHGYALKPGYVEFGSSRANVQLEMCIDAARWAGDPTDGDKRIGVMVLAHELAHVAGHRDEAETECVAMWALPELAVALGGTDVDGRETARWYQTYYNPGLLPEYTAPGCLVGAPPSSPMTR